MESRSSQGATLVGATRAPHSSRGIALVVRRSSVCSGIAASGVLVNLQGAYLPEDSFSYPRLLRRFGPRVQSYSRIKHAGLLKQRMSAVWITSFFQCLALGDQCLGHLLVGGVLDSRVAFPYPLQESHSTVDIASSGQFLAFCKHTGMERQVGTRTLVGEVSPNKLAPFGQGQGAPNPLAHLISQVCSTHLPQTNGLVITASRQPLAIRTEGYREDRTVMAT